MPTPPAAADRLLAEEDETDAHSPPGMPDGLPVPRRYWSVVAIWLAMAMSVLDGAIANVALPTIAGELHASPAASIWIVNAYQLAITVTLLPLAALGDRLGYRRVYMVGIAVFTVGSLCCALSHTLPTLTAARVLQGLGAGGIMSINAALVRFTYPKRQLGRGIGLNAVVISISAAIGPTVAAAILAKASWEWLFAINVPIGVVAIVIASRALPVTVGSGRKFDVIAALLNAATFGFLITGVESVVSEGLASGLSKLAIGAVAGALLTYRELRREHPLVPFDLLRIPIFGLSILTSIVSFAAQMMAYVGLPFYFQGVMGRTAVETGLLMTPWPLAVGLAAPIAGRLADRYRAGALGGIGLVVFAAGLGLLSAIQPGASNLDIAWRMAVCGLGFGFFQSPNNRAMVTAAPMNRSGAAGGALATARLLGQTAGAVTTAVFFHLAGTHATTTALATAGALAALAALVSLSRLRLAPRPRPERPDQIGNVPAGP
ncbi:MAG: multidrug transporter [Phenylobacterium sp.]|uniref:MFS transporter n=1 Tax=Phenylobacterium sp. TaxID=1871053 RepID=UPI00260E4C2C|nr:MFS transporter [Phenylobacterium sp.]MDB5497132.1 multidrug transporter [Phenylobacterium sp.]